MGEPVPERWRDAFHDARLIAGFEGGAVYAVDRQREWWLIVDQSAALDLLDEDDRRDLAQKAVRVERFEERDAWEAAVDDARRRASPPGSTAPTAADVGELPPPGAPWAMISRFAGRFNGYRHKGGQQQLAAFGRRVREQFDRTGRLPADLDDLRSALFYEQRSDHFAHSAESPGTLAYIHALVEAIRRAAAAPQSRAAVVARALPAAGAHLVEVCVPAVGGDLKALRERHLAEAVRTGLGQVLGVPVASAVLPLPEWPSLGRSGTDYVARTPGGLHIGELKWCQRGHDKVYEAIWDLFKMALAERRDDVASAHLITGAPKDMWPTAGCADLFDGGSFTPQELCARRFPRGQQRTMWDYLLEGGYDCSPEKVPARITTSSVGSVDVGAGPERWTLRAITVTAGAAADDVRFIDGWPDGQRPADARRPAPST